MKTIQCLLLCFILGFVARGQSLESGDLLFQNLDCGAMCDAIEAVTEGYQGMDFSHVGIVERNGDSVFVIEAIGDAVQRVSLNHFRARNDNQIWVGRLKKSNDRIKSKILAFAKAQIGKPYDGVFEMKSDRYYCSELVYDAFRSGYKGKEIFLLFPMTFKEPGKSGYFPVWETYYRQMGVPIPEGKPGINPGGISRSKKLRLFPLSAQESGFRKP